MIAPFVLYYTIGLMWVASGFLPRPFGWLLVPDDVPWWVRLVLIVTSAVIWPWMFFRILRGVIRGDDPINPFW